VTKHPKSLSAYDDLLDAAADVAGNLLAYGSYRGSPRIALAALRRRRPGFSAAQYQNALDAGIAAFDSARAVVKEYLSAIQAPGGTRPELVEACARELAQLRPGFPAGTYEWLVSWVYLYFHEM
jgi:hypothetical protein